MTSACPPGVPPYTIKPYTINRKESFRNMPRCFPRRLKGPSRVAHKNEQTCLLFIFCLSQAWY